MREWLKEKRKENEREGRRLKDLIRLEQLRMIEKAIDAHAALDMTALPGADRITADVRDCINDLENMYDQEADDSNDCSDDEHAVLTAAETLVCNATLGPEGGELELRCS